MAVTFLKEVDKLVPHEEKKKVNWNLFYTAKPAYGTKHSHKILYTLLGIHGYNFFNFIKESFAAWNLEEKTVWL